jgi:restriction endonuclease S subunit
MTFNQECVGKYFSFSKGLGYLGKYLSSSNVGLIGLNSFDEGGSYKHGGEKEYSGPFKPEHIASPGDLFISTTDITQDGRVLASPMLLPDLSAEFSTVIFSGDIVKAVSRLDGLLPEFLYNILRVKRYRDKAAYASTGTTVRRIPVVVIEQLVVPIPPLETQNAIIRLIRSIDEKIELNSRTAVHLEELAQTIFKSWFVDFDPVKAKMAEEKPVGMDDATAALFPDRMEDSELSPIPKGWELSQIGDEVECVGGSTPSTSNSEFWDGDICWTTPRDLSKQIGLITTTSERRITSKGLEKISSGVLPVNSVLMSSRAPIGYLSINAVPSAINQGFIALRQNPKFAPLYLLFWLQTNMAEIKNRAGGGTFAEISKTAFKSIPFVVPDEGILKKYEEISEPILLQLAALTLQNQELIELRDSLLPRLITGELQIPEKMLVT